MEFFSQLTEWTGALSGLLWGNPLTLLVLLGTGLYLTIRMGLVQARGFRHSIHLIAGKYSSHRDQGEVYLILGDAFLGARTSLGDDFAQRTAFWAAADMYDKAASTDPALAEDAGEKLSAIKGQYPSNEEIFFRDLKAGDSFRVGGCINASATIRTRD